MSQGRNCVLLSGHYLIHGHCGQHLQPDCWARRLYTLDCFTEQLVGLSVNQPITYMRRWRLSFTSFYPVMHRWRHTPEQYVSTVLYKPTTSHKSLRFLGMWSHRDTLSARLVQRSKRAIDGGTRRQRGNGRALRRWLIPQSQGASHDAQR